MSRSAAAGAGSSASPSSAPSTGSGASQLTPAQLTAQFNVKKQELTAIAQKIGELETESDEHTGCLLERLAASRVWLHGLTQLSELADASAVTRALKLLLVIAAAPKIVDPRLVIDTMVPLNPDRKCFRLVGGVLVERTIKEVLPALEANRSGVSFRTPPSLSPRRYWTPRLRTLSQSRHAPDCLTCSYQLP
ncbi:MAG: hypothetical protein BJ554DRAFT_5865 [Olpidium bornovanus]|uniref:Uncharacterized protein n=1 Tax=Olpidium bornovanus TaxID=278681 RepID=A0A8H7ZYU0_9FUNG|nr:MAG: hypothetical protein BJ554DRAFT_5865 [Olpidium bornovanus]